ncbi:IS5 family transposase [Streptomyces puniciscabiei]
MTTSGRMRLLTDEQWARLAPCLPRNAGKAGRPFADHRRITEGIIYRYRTGIPWRDLPREAFGPWQTVWKRPRRWAADGTWDAVLAELTAQADSTGGIDWTVSVDSTINRAHQHATNTTRPEKDTGAATCRTKKDADGAVLLRISTASELARAVDGAVVAFEADAADVDTHSGWSVVVSGRAELVTDPAEAARLERVAPRSWTPSPEEVFVRIEPELVTGRELVGAARCTACTSPPDRRASCAPATWPEGPNGAGPDGVASGSRRPCRTQGCARSIVSGAVHGTVRGAVSRTMRRQ